MTDAQKDIETLAALQALQKAIEDETDLNRPGNLRDRVNGYYHDLYEDTGATGFEVRAGGEKVGTYGFSKRKGQPERVERELQVTNTNAIREWVAESTEFTDWLDRRVDEQLADLALAYANDTGELPDGIEVVERTIPAVPDTIRPNGTLRIKRQVVERARNMLAGGGLAGLLGGGGE